MPSSPSQLLVYYAQSTALVWGCLGLVVKRPKVLLGLLYAHFAWAAVWGHFPLDKLIKVAMEAPLGLGAIVAYPALLSPEQQTKYLPHMTRFINLAVVGNIAMMSLLPTHGLWRGWTNKLACVALTAWLWRMMQQHEFETTEFVPSRGLFVFNAVSMDWVLCHAAYRLVMISLPSFYTLKYVALEPNSLLMTAALWQQSDQQQHRPASHWFGMADTVCAASFSLISTLPFMDNAQFEQQSASSALLSTRGSLVDAAGAAVHLAVCLVATVKMREGAK